MSEHFYIEDDMTAEWCMAQIRDAIAQKKKWKDFYDERYRIVCEKCDETIQNMEAMLQSYFARVPHKVTKTQENYTLPSGKLVFKKQEPEYERDDKAILKYLHGTGNVKFIRESVDWAGLKRTLTVVGESVADEDGTIIDGIKAVERPDIFKVELKKEETNDGEGLRDDV